MPIARFLDPKNDFAFKQIFGTEKNKDILIHFLNDILNYRDQERIVDVSFLKTVQDPDIAMYKQSIVDVLCQDAKGTQFIVEMQVTKHRGFEKRAQYYASKAYSQQVIKEDDHHKKLAVYAKLKGVIFLAIADFVMFTEKKNWRSEHRILDTTTYENDLKDFYFIFLELPKFDKTIDELETIQEKWVYFFKYAHNSSLVEMEHLTGQDKSIKRAFQAIDQASWSESELRTYEQTLKTYLDNLAIEQEKLANAEAKGIEIGKAEGKIEGEAIGLEKGKIEGEAIGLEKGKIEGKIEGKVEIARKLLQQGLTPEVIATITDLDIKMIFNLD
jgi:predicted transposase/invertase (TIGR01784 family)